MGLKMKEIKIKKTVPLFIDIDRELKLQLMEKADVSGLSVSALVRGILKGFLIRQRKKAL